MKRDAINATSSDIVKKEEKVNWTSIGMICLYILAFAMGSFLVFFCCENADHLHIGYISDP